MKILTSSPEEFTSRFFPELRWQKIIPGNLHFPVRKIVQRLIGNNFLYLAEYNDNLYWSDLLYIEHAAHSQFEQLRLLSRSEQELHDKLICLAGSGENFRGYKNRRWVTMSGNLHLSFCFTPQQDIPYFHTAFTIIGVNSVLQVLDTYPALKKSASVKWVNDIIIDGGKIAGIIAHTQAAGNHVSSAVLGMGLNVETMPKFGTDIFVPKAVYLQQFTPCTLSDVLKQILRTMAENYQKLLSGKYDELLSFYISRSCILNKEVSIYSDPDQGDAKKIVQGKVVKIGQHLELYFEGLAQPVYHGRAVLSEH